LFIKDKKKTNEFLGQPLNKNKTTEIIFPQSKMTDQTASADSFGAQQKLAQFITNDMNPVQSTQNILASLKLISHFENADEDLTTTKIAKEELKYLALAMGAIQSNPALSQKFGNGFAGAQAVSGLLKQQQSERVYKDILNNILEQNDGTSLANTIGKINGGSAITPE
jgi:hypothetical protein